MLTLSVLALVLSVAGASTLQAALFGTRLPWQAQLSGFLVEGHIALQFRWPKGIRPAVQQVFRRVPRERCRSARACMLQV